MSLNTQQIARLESQGCSCDDWSQIHIAHETNLKYIRQVRFSGICHIGSFTRDFDMPGGMKKHSGIYRALLHNVNVGNDSCIENIKNYIANYDIGHDSFIENVDTIMVDAPSSFGNGVEVSVLNETGGREVTIHDQLTAHEAYMAAMYRHRPQLIERLRQMALAHTARRTSDRGHISPHSTIIDAHIIRNVYVGPHCRIEGASRLSNGSLMSRQESPIYIGSGVMIDDFIIQDGTSITDGTMLTRVYVGQCCTMGHTYSATDSLFFSNCQEENGEACSIFAGPFTVTHHKSTLLIAGMFSFMNAGSGSNQSNHMYKLGPIHQGSMERGAKTTSDSYILWPARIGAFSLVMGRHTKNPDTSQMPFSYLIEKNGETYIVPGINLRSVGTIRDAQKWPKRDKRHPQQRLDQINYNLLSPYTIDKMVHGLAILQQLQELSGATSDTYTYQSASITRRSLKRGIELYRIGIDKFLGNSLISHLEKTLTTISHPNPTHEQIVRHLLDHLAPTSDEGKGTWLDMAGLIAPHALITDIIDKVEQGTIDTLEALQREISQLHTRYYDLEWTWAYDLMLRHYHLDPTHITPADLITIIESWQTSVVTLDKMLYDDARKEFSITAQTGFGFDGTLPSTIAADFEQVRGDFESNPFVSAVTAHIATKTALGEKWKEILRL